MNKTSIVAQLESQINQLKQEFDVQQNDDQSKKQTIKSKLDDLNNKLSKEMISRRFKLEPEQFSPEVSVKHHHISPKKLTVPCRMKQIPANSSDATINYRGCQKMPLLCRHSLPVTWQQCSTIGNMSSYCMSEHY